MTKMYELMNAKQIKLTVTLTHDLEQIKIFDFDTMTYAELYHTYSNRISSKIFRFSDLDTIDGIKDAFNALLKMGGKPNSIAYLEKDDRQGEKIPFPQRPVTPVG